MVTRLAFRGRGDRLASGGELTLVWDVATGHKILTLRGRTRTGGDYPFSPCITFSQDGKHLAASQWDRTVNVWSAEEDDRATAR